MELARRSLNDPAWAPTSHDQQLLQKHDLHGLESTTRLTYNPSTGFNTNIVIITAAILLVLVCALGMNSLVKRFWSNLRVASSGAAHSYGSDSIPSPRTGIKKKELRSLPTLIYRESANTSLDTHLEAPAEEDEDGRTICPICLSEFRTGERLRPMPTCRHLFHASCVDTWLSKNSSCPTCRGDLTPAASSSLPPPQHVKLSERVQLQIVITTISPTGRSTTASLAPTIGRVVSVVGPQPLHINYVDASSSTRSSTPTLP